MLNTFDTRTTSSFGVSIGTGLMLESLFKPTQERYDKDREIPNNIDINDYKYHFYNIYTLMRNFLNAHSEKDKLVLLNNKNFTNAFVDEVNLITMLYQDTKCMPVLFIPEYEKVYKHFNKDKRTELHKSYQEIVILKAYVKPILALLDIRTVKGTYKLPAYEGNALITTNYIVDLNNNFKQLILLESHTGKIKKHWEWNTKYYKIGSKDLSILPFYEELLYILGDNYFALPMKIGIRNELYNLAIESKWTSRTTREKFLSDIRKSDTLNTVLKSYTKIY